MIVQATSEVQARLWTFIKSVSTEIGGFGYAWLDEPDVFTVNDVFLVPQVVSGSEVDFENDGVPAAIERASKDGVLGEDGFVWFSWHSHHTMSPFFSLTDEDCIEKYSKAGIPHLLSFVGCHDYSYKLRYDAFNIEHSGAVIPRIKVDDLKLDDDPDDPVIAAVYEEIDANVTKRKPKSKVAPVTKYVRKDDPGKKVEQALAAREQENGYVITPSGVERSWPWADVEWDDPDEAAEAIARLSAGLEVQ